jgi:hypothetical protein
MKTELKTVDFFENPDHPCNIPVSEDGLYLRAIDLLLAILETRNAADKAMKTIIRDQPQDRNSKNRDQPELHFSTKMKFPGFRQKSYGWNSETAIAVVLGLNSPKAAKFRQAVGNNITRFLGGDVTLKAEIDRNAASSSSSAQFFQRAVAESQTSGSNLVRDAEWKEHRVKHSIPAHHEMVAKTKNKQFEIKTSIAACEAIHGVKPKEYKARLESKFQKKVDKRKLKEYYPKPQQYLSTAFLQTTIDQVNGNNENELNRISNLFGDLCRQLNFHEEDAPQLAPPVKQKLLKK